MPLTIHGMTLTMSLNDIDYVIGTPFDQLMALYGNNRTLSWTFTSVEYPVLLRYFGSVHLNKSYMHK